MTKRIGVLVGIVILVGMTWFASHSAEAQAPPSSVSVTTKSGVIVEKVRVAGSCVLVVSGAGNISAAVPCFSEK